MRLPPIDPARWNAVWTADLDVLRRLRASGDKPEIEREIDVSFRGDYVTLKRVADASSNFGFSVSDFTERDEEGAPFLLLVRHQPATDDAMRELTETYLQIEDTFGVECDGWGCVAQAS
ncbi:ribonuclease E inhibitor RraB [Novosphingobium sp.]|uniref:ribonuclease E inhibitor RraB n=1 Tax=Novosphingobium sp. TaxID=1874826 RepID=UPI002B46D5DF|nr:ribonuclease E inhibitor RraB [Novosphingobium sp.]HKR93049.1 ribonuclease E inhibitor RraB [Novosphingobium sp.]